MQEYLAILIFRDMLCSDVSIDIAVRGSATVTAQREVFPGIVSVDVVILPAGTSVIVDINEKPLLRRMADFGRLSCSIPFIGRLLTVQIRISA